MSRDAWLSRFASMGTAQNTLQVFRWKLGVYPMPGSPAAGLCSEMAGLAFERHAMPIVANDNVDATDWRARLAFAEQVLELRPGTLTLAPGEGDAMLEQVLVLGWKYGLNLDWVFLGHI